MSIVCDEEVIFPDIMSMMMTMMTMMKLKIKMMV